MPCLGSARIFLPLKIPPVSRSTHRAKNLPGAEHEIVCTSTATIWTATEGFDENEATVAIQQHAVIFVRAKVKENPQRCAGWLLVPLLCDTLSSCSAITLPTALTPTIFCCQRADRVNRRFSKPPLEANFRSEKHKSTRGTTTTMPDVRVENVILSFHN